MVDADLLAAIDSGHLAGACLDVFRSEPVSPDHPFWHHPKITVTPRVSALTLVRSAARQVTENYRRMREARPLKIVLQKSVEDRRRA